MYKFLFILILLFLGNTFVLGQEKKEQNLLSKDTIKSKEINPLAPAKAAFFSAIVPGLGQAYNKKYWKIPIVYGAIGSSLYYYSWNNKKYQEFRDAYKSRLAGNTNDKYNYLDDSRLITAQRFYQRNRDISFLFATAFYILNIVDANVDAHLLQFNVNENLTLETKLELNNINARPNYGLALNYTF